MYTFAVCSSVLAGLGVGLIARLPAPLPLWPAIVLAVAAVVCRALGQPLAAKLVLLLALLLGAVCRGAATRPAAASVGLNETGVHHITCRVISDPSVSGLYRHFDCRLASVDGDEVDVSAGVAVTAPSSTDVQYGDTVAFSAALETPRSSSEAAGYAASLRRRGIGSIAFARGISRVEAGPTTLQRWLFSLRRHVLDGLRRAMPSPESSFAAGVVVGSDEGMPDFVRDDLRRSGLLHILVVSGYNVTMVAAVAVGPARRWLGWRATFWCGAAIGLAYALLTGSDPPVVRALAMLLIGLGARVVGRPGNGQVALVVAATAMAAGSPVLLLDASFQLSVAATAGLLWAQGVPLQMRWRGKALAPLADAVLCATAAMVVTLPLLAAHTGSIPLLGLVANVLAQPLQGLLFAFACLGAVAALGLPTALASLMCIPVTLVSRALLTLAHVTAGLPLATAETTRWSPAAVVLYYGALVAAVVLAAPTGRARQALRRTVGRLMARFRTVLALGFLTLATALALAVALDMPDGRFHVAFFDVGQGDAILLTSPDGHTMLVDGGRDPDVLLAHLGQALPFWQRSIDVVAATHADMDHLGGLLGLRRRYQVVSLVSPEMSVPAEWKGEWGAMQESAGTVVTLARGDRISFPDGVVAEVLSPARGCVAAAGGDNDCSLVLRVTYGDATVLLTGDAEEHTEASLLATVGQAVLLKAGHHGSANCSSAAFLAAVSPQVAVISVGDNNYGHPAPETLGRLGDLGVRVLRTDELGTVEFVTDGDVYVLNKRW